ncbi:MAG: enamine deaminase RidA [Thiotrichales bacterium]|nr:enamine deaminase RidA [Thiotrichales bacterium]
MTHQRYRKFNTRETYPDSNLDNDLCNLVKASGTMVFVRGQVGMVLERSESIGIGDAQAQTDQAMQNVKDLLEEAGSKLEHVCRIQVYITDRAYRDPVYKALSKWFKGIFPCATGLIVQGLWRPEWVVEIEATAVIPETQ